MRACHDPAGIFIGSGFHPETYVHGTRVTSALGWHTKKLRQRRISVIKVAIAWHSLHGHIVRLAQAAAKGCGSAKGIAASLVEVSKEEIRERRWKDRQQLERRQEER